MSVDNFVTPNKDYETIKNTVLTNLVKMISYRKWLKKEKIEKTIEELIKNDNDNMMYVINLDIDLKTFEHENIFLNNSNFDSELLSVVEEERKKSNIPNDIVEETEEDKEELDSKKKFKKNFDGRQIHIKILPQQKITTVEKNPALNDFIKKYDKYHKIIIVDNITEKPYNKLIELSDIEVFNEYFLMANLMEHNFSPDYNIIPNYMIKQFKKDYKLLNLHYLPIMYDTDPASKYLNLKKGQVVRIIRKVRNTEEAIGYRVVAKKGNAKI